MEHALFGSVNADSQPDLCFVLMPYREEFSEVWQDAIRPTAQELMLETRRADDVMRPGVVMRDIWESIVRSRVLVADLTGKNADVFYELGLAHALEKDVILISQSVNDLPFDHRHLRVISYGMTGRGLQELRANPYGAQRGCSTSFGAVDPNPNNI